MSSAEPVAKIQTAVKESRWKAIIRHVVRVAGVAIIRSIYHIRVSHPERIPRNGGALLLPNHVTFADAFFISASCERPVRFVMDETFMASPAIRVFCSLFQTVTIRKDQPREAIRVTIDALQAGELVCLFPEGQITRTGTLCELRRGFELIARKAGHPLIPMFVDGSWGSIFSFERNRYFKKRPYRIPYGLSVAFGRPIEPKDGDLETVRNGIWRAAAGAMSRRFAKHDDKPVWVNAHQIGQINALKRGHEFGALTGDPITKALPGLFRGFPELFRSPVEFRGRFVNEGMNEWVGGEKLRAELEQTTVDQPVVFYDFSENSNRSLDIPNVNHCPCLAIGGVVISMSMPDPPAPGRSEFQPGKKAGSYGKLLPGFFLGAPVDGRLRVLGPAAPREGTLLPVGVTIDAAGFLMQTSV